MCIRDRCEALLSAGSPRGPDLWRALRDNLHVNYLGLAKVSELTHLAFRIEGEQMELLREELISLPSARTDRVLFEVALAALLNGRADWLERQITADSIASELWRRKRAIVLSGFRLSDSFEEPEAWPEGDRLSATGSVRRVAAERRWRVAAARHWWGAFWSATERSQAFAAWSLFLNCVDRRCWAWISNDAPPGDSEMPLAQLKSAHISANHNQLGRAMEKNEERLDKTFVGRDVGQNVMPWLNLRIE